MAEQADVRRVALALPEAADAADPLRLLGLASRRTQAGRGRAPISPAADFDRRHEENR